MGEHIGGFEEASDKDGPAPCDGTSARPESRQPRLGRSWFRRSRLRPAQPSGSGGRRTSMNSRSALVAFAVLTGLVACSGTPKAASAPTGRPTTTAGPSAAPVPVVVSFRRGDIDTSGPSRMRDARLLPGRRLAVLTYGNGCPDRPKSVSGSGRQVTVVYRTDLPANRACTDEHVSYTAVLGLPSGVSGDLPLRVTVRLPGAASYTVAAR